MNIVLIHNFYKQPGGEDQVFLAEGALLEGRGHKVTRYTVHNDNVGELAQVALARATIWNDEQYRKLRLLFRQVRPELVHVHNTLPLVSLAAYYAAKDEGLAVVQTLHNYRVACVNGLFFRDGNICEDCLGKSVPWPGVMHGCYRNSRVASGVVASMLAFHKLRGTYQKAVDVYIALTEFSRSKFIEAGLPAEKVSIKPNFVDTDPGVGDNEGSYALFVGRLSAEKGLSTLLAAWERLGQQIPLKIVGEGSLAPQVQKASEAQEGVEWLGRQPRERVLALMKKAKLLVLPSNCYENFPMTLVEAFAAGLPVVASNLGGMASVLEHRRTGLHFTPGNPDDLAAKVEWAISHPAELSDMRRAARAEFEAKYTADRNYQMLMGIYERAVADSRA